MYKSMLPLLVVLVILSLGFFSLDFGSDLVGGALSDVEGYANSNEFFYDYQNLVASYDDGELSVVVNAGVGDIFVYKRAYYATDSWVELELESTSSDVSQVGSWNDSWIRGSAEASVEVPYDEYYVAAYVCRLYDHSDVLAEQAWNLGQQLLINNTFVDDFAYLCGVAGFDDGELVTDLWHINQVDCESCAPDPVNAICANDDSYAVGDQDWSSSIFCSQGALDGSDPDFPSEGSSVSWECLGEHGGDNRTCSASRDALVPVTGVCGSHNQTFSSDDSVWPTSGAFCDEGTLDGSDPDFPSEGSSVSWECLGEHGGDNRTCSASRDALVPVTGVCGSHNQTFLATTTEWPSEGSFCDPGSVDPASPDFPPESGSVSWTCEGANGGTDAQCTAQRESGDGTGTELDPYLIRTCQELQDIENDLTAHYALANDIDCSGFAFDPIGEYYGSYDVQGNYVGNSATNPNNLAFRGNLDGRGFSIINLDISTSVGGAGLFAYLGYWSDPGTVVKDLTISGSVSGTYHVGLLAAYAGDVIVNNVHVEGFVNSEADDWPGGSGNTGGLIGLVTRSTIEQVSASVTVSGESRTGGLIGYTSGTDFRKSYTSGSVFGVYQVGGFAGSLYGYSAEYATFVKDSYSRASVQGEALIGGFAGLGSSYNTVENSYSTGRVILTDSSEDRVGGFISVDQLDDVSNSYWDTQTSGQSSSDGGGVGRTTSQMKQQSSFSGWDFTNVWAIDSSINDGYPYLQNNPPDGSTSQCTAGSCPSGFVCESGSCVPEPECSSTDPCTQSGYVCEGGVCVEDAECTVDGDCSSGYRCQSGACELIGECASDVPCPSSMDCTSSFTCECDSVATCDDKTLNEGFCHYSGSGWTRDVYSCVEDANGCVVLQEEQACQWASSEDCYYRQGEAMCLNSNPAPEITFSTSYNGDSVTTFDIADTVYGRVIHIDSEVIEACAASEGSTCGDSDFVVLTGTADWSLASDGYVRAEWTSQGAYGGYVGDITYYFRGEGSSRTSSVTLTYTN